MPIRWKFLPILLALSIAACQPPATDDGAPAFDPIAYVDPFIGTGAHGHTFPGPTMPHGMVQLSPDTRLPGWDASSGYHDSDTTIYGFSHTHLSGTGIGDMGDILFLPFTGPATDSLIATFDKEAETATAGQYAVHLKNFDVRAELAVTQRTGMHRYTYPEGVEQKLLIDLGHVLQANWGHESLAGTLEFIDEHTIQGWRRTSGWAYDHPVFFYAVFSAPYRVIETRDGDAVLSGQSLSGKSIKTWLSFPDNASTELLINVGISSVSMEGAQKNVEAEADNWHFEARVEAARDAWRAALGRIAVNTLDEAIRTNFYTGLYHSMLAPMLAQDVDGRYRGMDHQIHQAEEGFTNYTVFSLWDTFRALHPLMTIIDREQTAVWIRALLRKYEEGGLLPKWPLASNYTGTMVGYPAVSLIADALSKGIDDFDAQQALAAAVISSHYQPGIAAQRPEPRAGRVTPRQLDFIARQAFIPADSALGSVSYGLESAYYDWCIAQLARYVGQDSLARVYAERATYYRHYFDPASGFMRAKMSDGQWKEPFNPYFSDHEDSEYIEGNAWQWSWFVPHDVPGLMDLMGGPDAFAAKLDTLFSTRSVVEGARASADISGLIGQYAHGNEPSHHIAYLYHAAGRPAAMQARLDDILQTFYHPTPDGLIGNEDCGQMSAWYVLNALGFYQVTPGLPVYTIGRPLIHDATIALENGRTFTIVVENNSLENKYVDRATLDGSPLPDLSFSHDAIENGGVLTIVMTGTAPS